MKTTFIKYLISPEVVGSKLPILCNQENFVLRDNTYKIIKALPGYHVIVNPAIKNNQDTGRPKNGMFVAFPNKIKRSITDVSPGHWRIQAIKIKTKTSTILLINSYFPTDPRRANLDENDLLETLSKIKYAIRNNEFDLHLWAGDINADFLRNTSHTRTVSDTIEELVLSKSWDNFYQIS